ncbi:hypothetical protein RclHR1_18720003 [Rhizophagus clarus]|uniref:Uncharacterized protein n=1 Tax=Rhizophagus clarus TaxID=94130 RepID=A0A2Z6QS37_9GLOM|nr:hypothetical protein RclHR1_18720003 [Rhizophagus clarus]
MGGLPGRGDDDVNPSFFHLTITSFTVLLGISKLRIRVSKLFDDRHCRILLSTDCRSLKDRLVLKKDNEANTLSPPINNSSHPSTLNPLFQIISVGGAEVISLPASAPIIASFLMSPLITYTILTLLLIAIIWFMVKK